MKTYISVHLIVLITLLSCISLTACTQHKLIIVVPDDYEPGITYEILVEPVEGIDAERTAEGDIVFDFSNRPTYTSLEPFSEPHAGLEFVTESGRKLETKVIVAGNRVVVLNSDPPNLQIVMRRFGIKYNRDDILSVGNDIEGVSLEFRAME